MLDDKGFDLWASGYDQSVIECEEENKYPFAGYRKVLDAVYRGIRMTQGIRVLDMGFGTGTLLKKLYDEGYTVSGLDFSEKMLDIAKQKMPLARLLRHDIADGIPKDWADERFDSIVCTYAVHHLPYLRQTALIREMLRHLAPGGRLLIGDIAFDTLKDRETCRARFLRDWDDEEYYPVQEMLQKDFPQVRFEKQSLCAGVFIFE